MSFRKGVRPGLGLVAAGLALAGGGCGRSDSHGAGDFAWAKPPHVYRESTDRVLTGVVRNTGTRPLEIAAKDLRMLDADGHRVPGVATFTPGYLHGLYPPTRVPKNERAAEDRRLGLTISLAPGKQSTLTLAWRMRPGSKPPVRISYGRTTLPIPHAR